MQDRTDLILELGALQRELALRGDDRAADLLKRIVGFMVKADAGLSALEARRSADRLRRPPRVPQNPQKSTESAEIGGIHGGIVPVITQVSTAVELPEQLQERVETTPRARQSAESAETDERTEGILVMLPISAKEEWPDVDRFLRRRPYSTWAGWGDAMLKIAGPGSQFTWADVAQVCRDDEALTRKVESPKGFRTFVLNARMERVGVPTQGAPDAGRVVTKIRGLVKQNPGRRNYLPRGEVEALGPDVLRAYEAVGGADRFLNLQPNDLPFLIRDFGNAMRSTT